MRTILMKFDISWQGVVCKYTRCVETSKRFALLQNLRIVFFKKPSTTMYCTCTFKIHQVSIFFVHLFHFPSNLVGHDHFFCIMCLWKLFSDCLVRLRSNWLYPSVFTDLIFYREKQASHIRFQCKVTFYV